MYDYALCINIHLYTLGMYAYTCGLLICVCVYLLYIYEFMYAVVYMLMVWYAINHTIIN